MTTHTEPLSADQQFRTVYAGIVAVAARCDGAVEDDGVGFNGQDTKFGRRIASVPFEEWTPAVKLEAARIASRYRTQIESYTGIDVSALDVVQKAQDLGTVTEARDDARGFERRQEALAGRSVDAGTDPSSSFVIRWGKRDPEFRTFLDAVRRLPGRNWNGQEWSAPCTREAAVALTTGDLAALPTSAAADAQIERLLAEPEPTPAEPEVVAEPTTVEEWNAKVRAARNKVVLDGDRVRISFDYDATLVAEVRNLPGRAYDGSSKTNTADLHPDVLAFADKHGLVVAPEVRQALESVVAEVSAEQAEKDLRKVVSGLANPAELPAEFVQRVLAATEKAVRV